MREARCKRGVAAELLDEVVYDLVEPHALDNFLALFYYVHIGVSNYQPAHSDCSDQKIGLQHSFSDARLTA